MKTDNLLIEKEVLALFCAQAEKIPIAIIAGSLLVVSFVYQKVPVYLSAGWLITITIVQLWRWKVLPLLPDVRHLDIQQKIKRAVGFSLLNGILLGLTMLFFPYISDLERLVISSLLISVCVGAIGSTAGYRPLFLPFSFPLMGSIILAFIIAPTLWGADELFYFVAVIYILLQFIFIGLARDFFQRFSYAQEVRLEREQANIALENALELAKKANSSKTRFLASASHDLRQPIHTLSLFIASLKMRVKDQKNAEIVEHMRQAMTTIDNQLDALLDISKLDSGMIELNPTNFDVLDLTTHLLDMHRLAQSESADPDRLVMRIHCNQPSIFVHQDRQHFERVLGNLIDNAIKYTPKGEINITLDRIGEKVQIAIEDTGIGIAEDEVEKIFEEFYQTGNKERDRSRGLGLGLSIVSRICKIMGVEIQLRSQISKGSVFTLSCDAVDVAPIRNTTVSMGSEDSSTTRILLIDNEPEILVAMETLLNQMNHAVDAYSNSESAIEGIRNRQVDIALIDYRLSAITNGLEVINEMKKISPKTRYILVTGDANISLTEEDCEIQIVYKPITLEKLKVVLK